MKNILNRVNVPVFLISFVIGIFLTYLFTPMPKVVFKYPKPDEVDNYTFKDDSGTCYKYAAQETSCPSDDSATEFPVQ